MPIYITQIEIGKKPKSTEGRPVVTKKSKLSTSQEKSPKISVGEFVVLQCDKYKDFLPQIGKLSSMDEASGSVNVEWLNGTYNGTWSYWKARGRVITENVPKRALITSVNFTKSMRLKKDDIKLIKHKYETAEFV